MVSKARQKQKRKRFIRLGIFLVLCIPAFFVFSSYYQKQKVLHDLSVIGTGQTVLVQVHDNSCVSCNILLSRVDEVIGEYPDIVYRIADLDSKKGKAFAKEHYVRETTLVLLDRRGRVIDTVSGAISENQVRTFLDQG